jgi:hypothetical protein
VPLRLDPAVHDALARWASDELRSTPGGREVQRVRGGEADDLARPGRGAVR